MHTVAEVKTTRLVHLGLNLRAYGLALGLVVAEGTGMAAGAALGAAVAEGTALGLALGAAVAEVAATPPASLVTCTRLRGPWVASDTLRFW